MEAIAMNEKVFPVIDPAVWERESTSETHTDPETGYTFEFVVYRKK